VSEASNALAGATLVWIEGAPRELRVGVEGGDVACCRAEGDEAACRLATRLERGGPNGGGERLYEDFEGRPIVRVTENDERFTLHFEDGELLHLEAVVNEDGCRMATRSELEQGHRISSLLDRAVSLLRGAGS
jgi:hypothetical protein